MNPRHRAAPARARTGGTRGSIRTRMAVILAVPTAALVALVLAATLAQVSAAGRAATVADDVELALAAQELIHAVQRERGLTSGLMGGATDYRPRVTAQRAASDRARTALDRLLARRDVRVVRDGLAGFDGLGELRGSVDAGHASRTAVLDRYTAGIARLNTALRGLATSDDPQLARGLDALRTLGDAKEAMALERGHLNGVFAVGRFTVADYRRFTEVRARKLDALERFRTVATPVRRDALDAALRTRAAGTAAALEERALQGAGGRRLGVSPPQWWAAMTTVVDDLRAVQLGVGADVRHRAADLRAAARLRQAAYGGGALLVLVVAVLLWLYTARSIVRPLRTLAAEARDVAERTLPAAVAAVQSGERAGSVEPSRLLTRRDEFAEVAGALDAVRRTAVELASEQAVLRRNSAESLANLGHRNQNLVRRQLGFITTLERDETDPGALANLFELDHLATRMRRNAESLLVLAGRHAPRRWSGPIPVGDVLRSAFAEVEEYRRVTLRRMDDARLAGTAAAEVAHLLAELVENALTFSPPDREVEVQARLADGEYHIAIVDQGVGMDPEALAAANERLRGEGGHLVESARRLGHHVVGRLAGRLGVRVWLHDSPLTGVTARVVLPASLLVEEKAPEPVPEPVPAGAPPERPVVAPVTTTRNGLVKRSPAAPRRPVRPARTAPPRDPAEVRSVLETFRSGVHRARSADPDNEETSP
ncbi:sensor protein BasS/PmrB [Actinomadura rubteroloni]|uniref:histidine kinase n=1 Tax=Actinomadura rubteroloni TaxID=1926885 RepID=A0A2P4ULF3_9ACTN|nr:nitrate- and nitrite sensing domain-containing protein [Actinomadura rubteroloni]POM25883.1 sensor protein BasS/PmrB [Actinomadura rubteroloni]